MSSDYAWAHEHAAQFILRSQAAPMYPGHSGWLWVPCLRPICLSSGVQASSGPVSRKSSKQWLQVWEALSPRKVGLPWA